MSPWAAPTPAVPPPPGLVQPCPGVTLPKSSQAKQGPPSPGWGPAGTGPDPPGSSCGNRHEPKAHVSTGGGHREQPPPPPPLPGAALAAASPKRGWGGAGSSRGGSGCQAQPGAGRWVLHVGTPSTAQPGAPRGAGCTSVPHRPDTRVRGSGSIHRGWGRAPRDAGYKKPPATCPQRWARPARPGGLMSDRVATQHRASTEPAPSQHPATCPLPGLSRVPTGSTAAPRESPGAARRGEQPGEPSASLGFACW